MGGDVPLPPEPIRGFIDSIMNEWLAVWHVIRAPLIGILAFFTGVTVMLGIINGVAIRDLLIYSVASAWGTFISVLGCYYYWYVPLTKRLNERAKLATGTNPEIGSKEWG